MRSTLPNDVRSLCLPDSGSQRYAPVSQDNNNEIRVNTFAVIHFLPNERKAISIDKWQEIAELSTTSDMTRTSDTTTSASDQRLR